MAVELTPIQNAMWRICGNPDNYISGLIAKANGMPLNYRGQADISVLKNYIVVMLAQPGKLDADGLVFPLEVYELFLSKFDETSWHYKDLEVGGDQLPPQNVSVAGNEISCDEHATKTVSCFKWNNAEKVFQDTEIEGSIDGGTVTFSGLANGNYVLGYSGDDFCSLVQTVSV